MKVTGIIKHEGREYQFAAVEKGEKPNDVYAVTGWDKEYCSLFGPEFDEFCDLNRWQKYFDKAGVEIDMSNVRFIIEKYETPGNW